jgi:hypothetical protein
MIKYKNYSIEHTLTGWYVCFSLEFGYLKADTLKGIKQLINEYKSK